MKIMVIGSGGREHAVLRALAKSKAVTELVVAPGNAGMEDIATRMPIGAMDIDAQVAYATQNGVDFVVVTPDNPLVAGAVDAFEAAGIPAFGPNKQAAQLEGSKAFAKDFMVRHDIPTAKHAVFDSQQAALAYVDQLEAAGELPVVVKADGLALGKGVTIAKTADEARAAVTEAMGDLRFGESGKRLVFEEFLEGPEVTVLCLTDGKVLIPMLSSTDHKRAYDGDTGPNTGGMGVVAPSPYYTPEVARAVEEQIFARTLAGLHADAINFTGCLYFGLMITRDGPKVIEYNARFGDPETQTILPLLEGDLFEIMRATTNGTLAQQRLQFSDDAVACVVMAAAGYPGSPRKGDPITVPADLAGDVIYAGVDRGSQGRLVTAGGRVLCVLGRANTLNAALDAAYEKVARISFEGAHFRTDIGQRALRKSFRLARNR